MTRSYLFAYYTLDSQVSLSSCTSIKTGLCFLSEFLFYYYSDLHYEKFKKNREKIKTNQKQYTLEIRKILRTTSLGSNFTGSYKKKQNRCEDVYRCEVQVMRLNYFSKFFSLFFLIRTKVLVLVKNLRISSEQRQTCCLTEHKNKVSRLAIFKIMTEYHNRACRLVQLSHFNQTKLFNDYISFVCLLYIGHSSFTSL